MDGLREKALVHGELTESEDGQVAVPGAGSTTAVNLWRVRVSLRAMKLTAGAGECTYMSGDSSKEKLLARGAMMATENEIEWELRTRALEKAPKRSAQEGRPRAQWRVMWASVLGELMDVFRGCFTRDPSVQTTPMRLKWDPHA